MLGGEEPGGWEQGRDKGGRRTERRGPEKVGCLRHSEEPQCPPLFPCTHLSPTL